MGDLVLYYEERNIDHFINKYLKTGDCGIVVNHATSSPTISKTKSDIVKCYITF